MKSKSPFRQDKCAIAWDKWKDTYDNKKEATAEKPEFYCDNGTIKLRPLNNADAPMTDAEIKTMKEKKNKPEFGKREKSIMEQ